MSSDPGTAAPSSRSVIGALRRWESALVLILIAVIAFGTIESPDFLTTTTIFFGGLDIGQIAIMALPLSVSGLAVRATSSPLNSPGTPEMAPMVVVTMRWASRGRPQSTFRSWVRGAVRRNEWATAPS